MAIAAPEASPPGAPRVAVLGDTREAHSLITALSGAGALASEVERATVIVDASHPFASEAEFDGATRGRVAGLKAQLRFLRLVRPPWTPRLRDDWREVGSSLEAFNALAPSWRRVFLALGRDRILPFQTDRDRWYLTRVRGAEEPLRLTPKGALAPEPGPFTVDGEIALLKRQRIDALVCRNVGGAGAFPKIEAACRLGLPVVMLSAPAPAAPMVRSVAAALAWIAKVTSE